MPSRWPSYPPSNRLFLLKVTRRGWRSYTTLQQVQKKGVTKLFPWSLTFTVCLEHLLKGSRTYFAHLRKRKKAYHIKMIFWEKSLLVFENWRSYPNWRFILKYESVVKQRIPIFLYFMPVIRIHNTGRNCIQINHTLAGKINSIVLGVNSAFPSMASPHPVPFVSFQQHL